MADDAPTNALHIHTTNGLDLSATLPALNVAKGIVDDILWWAERNQLLSIGCLLLVAWALWLRHKTNTRNHAQQIAYNERREAVRLSQQPTLQLQGPKEKDNQP